MINHPSPPGLNQDDVTRLMANPSAEMRAETTGKIAAQFHAGGLSPGERKIAEDIFRALAKDAEVLVRESLSAHLKSSPHLPHDVALSLARDVDSVALPMLKFSYVLRDEDLIEIVRRQSAGKQVAIAQRRQVSAQVANILIDTGNETAVARLVSNDGAELNDQAYGRVIGEYQHSESVSRSISHRPNLPATMSEQLVTVITDRLKDYLTSAHELPQDVATNLIFQARERATMDLIDHGSTDEELDDLIEHLHRKGRLTPSLLLRALCVGDMNFFERGLAKLADVALQNARILIHDQGSLGLQSIYLRAELPERLYPVFRAGIDLVSEHDYDFGANDRKRYIERLIERVLTQFEDPTARIAEDDIDYLMDKLKEIAA